MDDETHMNANSMPSRDPMASGVVNLSGMLRRVCPRYPIATGVSVEILMTPELICVKESARMTLQILAFKNNVNHKKHNETQKTWRMGCQWADRVNCGHEATSNSLAPQHWVIVTPRDRIALSPEHTVVELVHGTCKKAARYHHHKLYSRVNIYYIRLTLERVER